MARIKIGDLVEIKTSSGLTYAQYTHKQPRYGALLRIFDKSYKNRPSPLEGVLNDSVRFSTFFPLTAAINRGIFEIVGNFSVKEELKPFPLFRAGAVGTSGKVATWWLWDGEKEERIGKLSDKQKYLPIRGVWNDTLLIERIESGWTPYTDPITQK
ncbi:hypothetical protein BTA51_27455 [Hahella sp. CCB-MM4]|uniref:hypothetical protein n=1 Tax=Hahella sp. (strain CCB-MM4) TaxID=1926491 RepID=UPI000B9ABC20|nr:hypothetical protein [Hahella sp. CCB-MM4]OZG70205.1 hypothetical protein BTA51_27455 [Hahella sp. CCB-MM4]